jgi:hypothetical protein
MNHEPRSKGTWNPFRVGDAKITHHRYNHRNALRINWCVKHIFVQWGMRDSSANDETTTRVGTRGRVQSSTTRRSVRYTFHSESSDDLRTSPPEGGSGNVNRG